MKTLSEFNESLENKKLNSILDNVLMISDFKQIRNKIKNYINKNYQNVNKIYLVFDNADDAQAWVDFSYYDNINGKKFSELNGNFLIDNNLYNKSKTYLSDVTNKNLLENIDMPKDFPILSMTAFGNKMKIVYSNRMKVDKYNITAYLIEI